MNNNEVYSSGCTMILVCCFIPSILIGLWTQSNINDYFIYEGGTGTCSFLSAWILSVVAAPVMLILNILYEIFQILR